MHKPHTADILHLHFVVIILGFTAILGKLISLPALSMVWWRLFIAIPFIYLYLRHTGYRFNPDKKLRNQLLLTGVIVGAHWLTFFGAIKVANVSVALAGFASVTLFTALIEPLAEKRAINLIEVALGLATIAGLLLIYNYQKGFATGLWLAILSALLNAVFMVQNRQYMRAGNPVAISYYELIGALLFLSVCLGLNRMMTPVAFIPQGYDILWLPILAIVCTAYAYTAGIKVMRSLTAYLVVLTINLEPIYGIVMAHIIFTRSEIMTTGFYVGTTMILLAVFLYPVIKHTRKAAAKRP